jgi:hypothetical protein
MGVSDMKKFLINIAIFFAIVAAVDFSLGKVFHYLHARVAGGRTGAEYYVCKKGTENIVIMGSSRASHHYVPDIISEKCGMSCFNAGQDGNGIILQYGRWKMLSKRYVPQLILYDINLGFDLIKNDNMTYIDRLKPFCAEKDVKTYVATIFPTEGMKVLSNMYCYNYKFLEMTFDCIGKGDYLSNAGYIPLYGHIREEMIYRHPKQKKSNVEIDEVKLQYLEQFVKEATSLGVKVVFVVSPSWKGGIYTTEAYSIIKELSNKYALSFYDYTDSDICDNPDYFEDSSHLNNKGARVFTEDIISLMEI